MAKTDLSVNHWTLNCFKETMTTKELQYALKRHGSWVFRNGRRSEIKNKKIGPGMYEVWLEDVN